MTNKKELTGHLTAIISVVVWGTTFVASKTLLKSFSPTELLFFRFTIAFIALLIVHPKMIKTESFKEELLFMMAGLTGVTLYFGFESTALTYTSAVNVGIIVSLSPFFTAILSRVFLKEDRIKNNFIIGFILAFIGIVIISTEGDFRFTINVFGDIMAVLSAVCWSAYSIFIKRISALGHNNIAVTRRVFFYGVVFALPMMLISDFSFNLSRFSSPENLMSILYLGLGASAICFLIWNIAVNILGALKASIYIYLVPVVSLVSSALFLGEKITIYSLVGILFILTGLVLSEKKSKKI